MTRPSQATAAKIARLFFWGVAVFCFGCRGERNGEAGATRPDQRGSQGVARPSMQRVTLRVAAASDLRHVFEGLEKAFLIEHPEVDLVVTYGSSGQLFAQLKERAPCDLYLAADIEFPRRLVAEDDPSGSSVFAYARGYVVLFWPGKTASSVVDRGPEGLRDSSIKRIAIANSRHAPYGRAAEASLRSLGLLDDVATKLVMAENVAQAAQFVESGAADVGLFAKSMALSPALRERGRFQELPLDSYPPLIQGGIVVPWSQQPLEAAEFQRFLTSETARAIFTAAGFGGVEEE